MGNLLPSGDFDEARVSTDAAFAEMRAAPRFTLLIRAAKVSMPGGEFLCVIRDASETGLSARIFHPLPVARDTVVELQNGDRYAVEIVWQNDERVGFRFHAPADVAAIIDCPSEFARRPVRINLTAPAEIETPECAQHATIQDISQQGAKVACPGGFAIDQRVKLRAAGLRDIHAKVRWRREGTCGLVFENTFQFGELARIARDLQARDSATRS